MSRKLQKQRVSVQESGVKYEHTEVSKIQTELATGKVAQIFGEL